MKAILEIEMPNDFEVGQCNKCRFAKGTDQCKLIELLTDWFRLYNI
jgi:hypothetical protein